MTRALLTIAGAIAWCAWKLADRWTAHIEHVRRVKRCAF